MEKHALIWRVVGFCLPLTMCFSDIMADLPSGNIGYFGKRTTDNRHYGFLPHRHLGTMAGPDYIITTAGGHLIITDVSGNSETLGVIQIGGNIRFTNSNTSRTYSINSGPTVAFTTPADIALAGLNSITINTEAGNDVINIGAFTANLPSLTINGGTGNDVVNLNGDITFATDANLDIDLQNDAATPGTDRVQFANNANIVLSGSGQAIVKASRDVSFNIGSSLETVNGNLTIEANQQATATSGNFTGVSVVAAIVRVNGTGLLTVKGRGGNTASDNEGIAVSGGGKIIGGTVGNTYIEGIGGNSNGHYNYGVWVTDAGTMVTSLGSNVIVNGTGSGTNASHDNIGVEVSFGAGISAGGSGTVTVTGQGSVNAQGNHNIGVLVAVNNAFITSSGGNVTVNGTGGGTGTSSGNRGVEVASTGSISAGGSGTVTITGQGGINAAGDFNPGVWITDAGTMVTSSGGNITINGTGGGLLNSDTNIGTTIRVNAVVSAGGSGTVTVTGQGGLNTGGDFNHGVKVSDNATLTSSGGNVSVIGTGGGTTPSIISNGVEVVFGGVISAGGSGTVTVTGQGGIITDGNGVFINNSNSRITSSGGNVTINGAPGLNSGVGLLNNTVNGITTAINGGNIIINANSVKLDQSITAGSNTVTIRPQTPGVAVNLGATTDPLTGPLSLSETELNSITASTLIIGSNTAGDITVSSNITRTTAVNTQLISGADIITAGNLNVGGTLLLDAGVTTTAAVRPEQAGTDFTASTATLNSGEDLLIRINGTTPDTNYDVLNVNGNVNLNNAVLRITGVHTPTVGEVFTIVNTTGAVTGTFNGLPNGANITNFMGSGLNATVTYLANQVQLTVSCPVITISPATMPNGTVGSAYPVQTLTHAGLTGTPTWTISSGTLPAGLTLSGNTISGTPSVTGTFNFTVQVTVNGCTATQSYTVNIVPAVPPLPILPPPSGLNMSTLPILQDRVFNPNDELINPQMRLQNGQPAQASTSGPIVAVFERGRFQGYRITGVGRICFTFFGQSGTNSRAQVCFNVTPAPCAPIEFAPLANVQWNTAGQPLHATSCGRVNFRVVSGPADIAAGMVRPLPRRAGTVTVEAAVNPFSLDVNRDGTPDYEIPAPVRGSFEVLPVGQTITFPPLPVQRADAGFRIPLFAFASSGLPVTFTVVSGNGRIEGSELVVTGGGEIIVEATQQGNEAWLPAVPVRRTVEGVQVAVIRERQPQAISFNLPSGNLQNGFALLASATSGLPVSFAIVEGQTFVRIEGGNLVITARPTQIRRITIEATQGGDDNFLPAEPVRRSFLLLPQIAQTVLLSTGALCQGSAIRAQVTGNFGTEASLRLVVSDNEGNFNGGEGFLDARLENANTLISFQTHNLPIGTYRVRIDVLTADGIIIGIPSAATFQMVAFSQNLGITQSISATGGRMLSSSIATGNSWTHNGQPIGNTQTVEAMQPGWYQLNIQTGNCTFSASVFISENFRTEEAEAAVNEPEGRIGFRVYPNPSNGKYTVQGRQLVEGEMEVVISDMQGRIISRQTVSGQRINEQIDLSYTTRGVYLLQIRRTDGSVWTEKLVKE